MKQMYCLRVLLLIQHGPTGYSQDKPWAAFILGAPRENCFLPFPASRGACIPLLATPSSSKQQWLAESLTLHPLTLALLSPASTWKDCVTALGSPK